MEVLNFTHLFTLENSNKNEEIKELEAHYFWQLLGVREKTQVDSHPFSMLDWLALYTIIIKIFQLKSYQTGKCTCIKW